MKDADQVYCCAGSFNALTDDLLELITRSSSGDSFSLRSRRSSQFVSACPATRATPPESGSLPPWVLQLRQLLRALPQRQYPRGPGEKRRQLPAGLLQLRELLPQLPQQQPPGHPETGRGLPAGLVQFGQLLRAEPLRLSADAPPGSKTTKLQGSAPPHRRRGRRSAGRCVPWLPLCALGRGCVVATAARISDSWHSELNPEAHPQICGTSAMPSRPLTHPWRVARGAYRDPEPQHRRARLER